MFSGLLHSDFQMENSLIYGSFSQQKISAESMQMVQRL